MVRSKLSYRVLTEFIVTFDFLTLLAAGVLHCAVPPS